MSNLTIALDAGHGGSDPGATYNNRQEKDDVLRLSRAVGSILENSGINVFYVRNDDEYETPFKKATDANNAGADFFISLHRNSSEYPNQYSGVESLVYEDSGIRAALARNINHELEKVGFNNIGVTERKNLVVLRRTQMPAVLVEVGFINTDKDNELFDKSFDEIAQAIATGILNTVYDETSKTSVDDDDIYTTQRRYDDDMMNDDRRDMDRDMMNDNRRDMDRDMMNNDRRDMDRDMMNDNRRDMDRDMMNDDRRDMDRDMMNDDRRDMDRDMMNNDRRDMDRDMMNDNRRDMDRDMMNDNRRDMDRDMMNNDRNNMDRDMMNNNMNNGNCICDSVDDKLYRIQVGAYQNKENADRMLNSLLVEGFPAFMIYDDGYYKVQVGAFLYLTNAIKMEQRLRRFRYNTYIVYD